jgi:hypothetical protein
MESGTLRFELAPHVVVSDPHVECLSVNERGFFLFVWWRSLGLELRTLQSRRSIASSPFLSFFFFFLPLLGFELRAYTSPFFVMSFFEIGSRELFARAGFEPDPSDLCLLSS